MGTTRVICFIALISYALLESPPRMIKQPIKKKILFRVASPEELDRPFTIECEAEGEPAPQYKWIKNGKPLEITSYDNRISQQSGRGTIEVNQPLDEDLGEYECLAYNKWGTTHSDSVFVRRDDFVVWAKEGKPFKLTCEPPDSYPKPKVYWMLEGDWGQLEAINNARLSLDPEGNLWFSNVTRNDTRGLSYVCTANSIFKNEYQICKKVILRTTPVAYNERTLNRHRLVRQYTTRNIEKALKGTRVELYCIYGGTPLPQIVWKKNGQSILWSERITQDNYGKTLVIKSLLYEDQGTYNCEVSNGVGPDQSHSILLNIEDEKIQREEVFHTKSNYYTITIIVAVFGALMILILTIVIWKQCWIKDSQLDTTPPQLPTNNFSLNRFYANLLFRRECDAEIEEIENHTYEEIEEQRHEGGKQTRQESNIYEEL